MSDFGGLGGMLGSDAPAPDEWVAPDFDDEPSTPPPRAGSSSPGGSPGGFVPTAWHVRRSRRRDRDVADSLAKVRVLAAGGRVGHWELFSAATLEAARAVDDDGREPVEADADAAADAAPGPAGAAEPAGAAAVERAPALSLIHI